MQALAHSERADARRSSLAHNSSYVTDNERLTTVTLGPGSTPFQKVICRVLYITVRSQSEPFCPQNLEQTGANELG